MGISRRSARRRRRRAAKARPRADEDRGARTCLGRGKWRGRGRGAQWLSGSAVLVDWCLLCASLYKWLDIYYTGLLGEGGGAYTRNTTYSNEGTTKTQETRLAREHTRHTAPGLRHGLRPSASGPLGADHPHDDPITQQQQQTRTNHKDSTQDGTRGSAADLRK